MVYQPDKLATKATLAQFEKNKKEVLGALPAIEKRLLEQPYLCGSKMTIGDIVVFNELSMFLEINDWKPNEDELREFPSLQKWLTGKMYADPVLQKLDQEMKNAAKGLKKSIPTS